MGEQLHLILNGCDHPRRAIANRGDGNSGPKIDQAVAIDIDDHATAGFDREDGHCGADASGDSAGLPRHELQRARARDCGLQNAALLQFSHGESLHPITAAS